MGLGGGVGWIAARVATLALVSYLDGVNAYVGIALHVTDGVTAQVAPRSNRHELDYSL